MRMTISHNRNKDEIKRVIDRAFAEMVAPGATAPIQIVQQERNWSGDRLTFDLTGKMGLLRSGAKGFVDVGEREVTIEADLGLFEKLIASPSARNAVESRVRQLLV